MLIIFLLLLMMTSVVSFILWQHVYLLLLLLLLRDLQVQPRPSSSRMCWDLMNGKLLLAMQSVENELNIIFLQVLISLRANLLVEANFCLLVSAYF